VQATEIDRSHAHLLARWPCELRQAALEHVAEQDLAAAQRIREHLIGFPDLPRLDEDEIRSLLGCLELGDLALAMKDAPQEIEEAIERALTPRVRQRLSEERAQCSDAAPAQSEQAREHLVEMLRDLFERGSIDLHEEVHALGSKE
jgi:flagellar motor switch protein FliG